MDMTHERRRDRSLVALVWASLFALLIATHSGHMYSIDGLMYYRSADRLATALSLTFDPPVHWAPGDGITATVAPIGFSLALAPAVLAAAPFRDQQPPLTTQAYDSALMYGDGFYAAVSWVNPALAALAGALVVIACRWLGVGRRLAVAAGFATVVSGPLLWYARADYAQPLTTVLLLATVLVTLRARRVGGGGAWLAPLIALAILTRPVDGVLTAFVAVTGLVVATDGPARSARRLAMAIARVAAGVAVGVATILAVNAVRRGSPLDFGYGESFGGFLPAGLLAYLVSPGRGFAWHLPLVLVAAPGVVALWRAHERIAITLLTLPFIGWLVVYGQWIGLSGWAYGPRFLVPLVPLAVILAAVAVAKATSPWPRRGFVVAATTGAALAVSAVVVDQFYFFGIIGANQWGTPGFWREFSPDAFAPVASWFQLGSTFLGHVPDIWWFRQAEGTGGWSLIVPAVLVPIAVALAVGAWRVADDRQALTAAASTSARV